MITVLDSSERGYSRYGWLETYHTFWLAGNRDSCRMVFRGLRVIDEDRVQPGR